MCVCIYICIGILLRHKKEWNNAICCNMDGLREYHTKWSKPDKDKYHTSLICGIIKWYKWTYLQNRNRPTDIENKHGYQRERGGGIN